MTILLRLHMVCHEGTAAALGVPPSTASFLGSQMQLTQITRDDGSPLVESKVYVGEVISGAEKKQI